MGTISEKLTYLNDTKSLLKDSINSLGGEITSQTTFRQYATELDSIYSNLPKVSGTGSIISLSPTLKGRLGSVLKGNTLQDGTPTPTTPVEIQSVTGLQKVSVEGKNLLNAGQESYTFSANANNNNQPVIGTLNMVSGTKYYISYNVDTQMTSNTRSTPRILLNGTTYYQNGGTNQNLTTGRKVWEFTASSSGEATLTYWSHTPNVDLIVSKFMISTSSDTTYEPYQTPITKQLNLGNIKLNKIEDYQDYIIGTPYNWVIKGQIGNIASYNGETITTDYISSTGQLTTGANVIYVLTTETTEPITNQEIINQLNEIYYLQSYNGTTNISVQGDLPMILDVSAIKGE